MFNQFNVGTLNNLKFRIIPNPLKVPLSAVPKVTEFCPEVLIVWESFQKMSTAKKKVEISGAAGGSI